MADRIWQVDFYRRPLQDEDSNALWELLVCDSNHTFVTQAFCSQPKVNSAWLTEQLQQFADAHSLPDRILVFRPQAVSLLQAACQPLGVQVEPTRRTPALKQALRERVKDYRAMPNYTHEPYDPIELERPAPVPLPKSLWGENWRFAAITAQDLMPVANRPIPILDIPDFLLPIHQQVPSTTMLAGVVIEGGRQSMHIARWIQEARPVALHYIPGEPDGLILETGLVERWVLNTFTDPEVKAAAQTFQTRQQQANGLHFLLVQPDDSGVTYSGFWLLQMSAD